MTAHRSSRFLIGMSLAAVLFAAMTLRANDKCGENTRCWDLVVTSSVSPWDEFCTIDWDQTAHVYDRKGCEVQIKAEMHKALLNHDESMLKMWSHWLSMFDKVKEEKRPSK